ncbi:uncharacterized protein LOC135208219 [Macrobrachium nipponense]|uniref:uncharacterized protein LOC135208219 n=1 Tax=Macrobrachium nipponense TaxID=159736 RepID=UPI0030C7D951
MKVALLLLATLAAVSAQSEPWCRCAAFVTYEYTEMMVYEAPEVTIDSCQDDVKQCKNRCSKELAELTNDGDLWSLTAEGITVGQHICSNLLRHLIYFLHNHKIYGYYEVCGGAWQYAGVMSQQMLCCNGGKHEHCIS